MRFSVLGKYLSSVVFFSVLRINPMAQPQWALDTVLATGTNSSGIAVTPDGSKIVVTNNMTPGAIQILAASNYAMQTVAYAADGYPNGVAVTPDGSTAVVNTAHQTVFIDLNGDSVSGSFFAPCPATTLYGLAISGSSVVYPDLDSGCVEQGLRIIGDVPPVAASVFIRIPTAGELLGIALASGAAVVSASNAAPVVVDLATSGIQNIAGLSASYGVAALHHSNEALIFDGDSLDRVSLADAAVSKKITAVSFSGNFQDIAISGDDRYAFVVGSFEKQIVALANDSILQTISGGGGNVATDSDGSRFYVTNSYNGTVSVYQNTGSAGINSRPDARAKFSLEPAFTMGKIAITAPARILAADVYDLSGAKVLHAPAMAGSQMMLDLSSFSKGLYFVSVRIAGRTFSGKVVLH